MRESTRYMTSHHSQTLSVHWTSISLLMSSQSPITCKHIHSHPSRALIIFILPNLLKGVTILLPTTQTRIEAQCIHYLLFTKELLLCFVPIALTSLRGNYRMHHPYFRGQLPYHLCNDDRTHRTPNSSNPCESPRVEVIHPYILVDNADADRE